MLYLDLERLESGIKFSCLFVDKERDFIRLASIGENGFPNRGNGFE